MNHIFYSTQNANFKNGYSPHPAHLQSAAARLLAHVCFYLGHKCITKSYPPTFTVHMRFQTSSTAFLKTQKWFHITPPSTLTEVQFTIHAMCFHSFMTLVGQYIIFMTADCNDDNFLINGLVMHWIVYNYL